MTAEKSRPALALIWRLPAWFIAFLVLIPISAIFLSWRTPDATLLGHFLQTSMPAITVNTLALLVGVVTLSSVLGTGSAFLVCLTDLPGRSFFKYAMLFALAIPGYVTGFVYCGLLDFAGPVQSMLREHTNFSGIPGIRNLAGCTVIMALALYPYIYLLSLSALETQGRRAIEAAQAVGVSPLVALRRSVLPMALPWITGGAVVVGMETLADFGTVSLFMVETLTTAIYKAWYGFFSPITAAQLSTFLLVITLGGLFLRESFLRKKEYTAMGSPIATSRPFLLSKMAKTLAVSTLSIIFVAGFLLPISILIYWTVKNSEQLRASLAGTIFNTVIIGLGVAGTVCLFSLMMTMAVRFSKSRSLLFAEKFSLLGYALPGSVLAIGFYLPMVAFDRGIAEVISTIFGTEVPLLITGTVLLMITGLVIRFFAIGHSAVGTGMKRINRRLDEAALSLGKNHQQLIRLVHMPLLARALVIGGILTFIDTIKEMPLTLMTRPFGWDTLSTKIFEWTSEGEWERAAVPALLLTLSGMVSVFLLAAQQRVSR